MTVQTMQEAMQEAFDIAAKGVIGQGEPSVSEDGDCRYRGDNGCKCNIGWLIADDEYESWMDYKGGVPIDVLHMQMPKYVRDFPLAFLKDMQKAHDEVSVFKQEGFIRNYVANMRRVAKEYDLRQTVLPPQE